MKQLNSKFVDEIVSHLPNKRRLAQYLIELLGIGKESAYRRMKSEIPFSFEEVAAVSGDLGLSLDQLLGLKADSRFSFYFNFDVNKEPSDAYANMLAYDNTNMEKILSSSDMKITAVVNRIPLRFFPYKALFKFDYCQYLYSIGNISLMTGFSDINVPPHINDLHNQSTSFFSNLRNITCIIDSTVYSKIINEIQHYYRLKFISDEDLKLLQTELFELLAMYESTLRKGKNIAGSNYTVYYSLLNIDSNVVCVEYDNKCLLQVWVYPEGPIEISDISSIRGLQEKWIDSKIRNSVLVSKTNDTLQIEMLHEVQKQISELTNLAS